MTNPETCLHLAVTVQVAVTLLKTLARVKAEFLLSQHARPVDDQLHLSHVNRKMKSNVVRRAKVELPVGREV